MQHNCKFAEHPQSTAQLEQYYQKYLISYKKKTNKHLDSFSLLHRLISND